MDFKLFVRVGAVTFVAVALTVSLLQMRNERPARMPEVIAVLAPDGDPLAARLQACSEMGELALSASDCREAWAEKRRRFLGARDDTSASSPEGRN